MPTFAQDRLLPKQALFCGALAMVIDLAMGGHRWKQMLDGVLLNPDSYMRLVRLDDILAAGSPIDVVARDGSGTGTLLYWSHLLDSLLLLLAAPLAPLLGEHDALLWAAIISGPLSAGLLGIALAWATAPFSNPEWRWTAALVGAAAFPIAGYALPGVVHHHVLVALSAVMCAGWAVRAWRGDSNSGCGLGAWAAFGLWLSPEVMPTVFMAIGAVGLGWLKHPGEPRWGETLAAATTSLFLLTALILAADPPVSDPLGMAFDRISLTWLIIAGIGAVAAWALAVLDRLGWPRRRRTWLGCGVAVTAAAICLALFPSMLQGTDAVVQGEDASLFFAGISEMLPVTSWADAMIFLSTGAFAVIVAAAAAIRGRSVELAYVAVCLLILVFAAMWHRRFSTYGACAGAAAVPVAITMISGSLRRHAVVWAAAARVCLLSFLVLAPFGAARASVNAPVNGKDGCNVQAVAPLLRPFDGQVLLADINDTPELLYRSKVLTVGSLYHRNAAAHLRLIKAWRSQHLDAGVPADVTATRASGLLFCRQTVANVVANPPPGSLWDRLRRNDPPVWLQELPTPPGLGVSLFRLN